MRHTGGVYYEQIERDGGEVLHIADECDHVRWIKPEELVSPEPICCEIPGCFGRDRTGLHKGRVWRKVYVRT